MSSPAQTETTEVLREQLDEARRRAESLRRVIESISGELALEPLLTRIVESAVTLIGARQGSIGLVAERDGAAVIRTAAIYNMPARELNAEMPPGTGIGGAVLQARRPIRLERYGDLEQPPLPELADHAVIGVPIWWGDQMIGFFGIGAPPPARFGDADVETLGLFARHAAVAIVNARLFAAERSRAARIEVINRIGRLIAGSLSLEAVFQTAVESIHTQLRYAYVAAGLVAQDDPEMLVLVAHASSQTPDVAPGYRQSIQVGIVGEAARTRRRVLVSSVADDPRYVPMLDPSAIQSELAVPIVVGDRLLGVLNIESAQSIDEDDAAGVQIIADQLGAAIDNARLFAETERALERTRLLYETSRRISAALSVDEVIATYLEHMAARGSYACGVMLYEFDEAGARVARRLHSHWTPRDGLTASQERLPYVEDPLALLLDSGQTVRIADIRDEPRLSAGFRDYLAKAQWWALAMIPLIVRGRRLGMVWLSYPDAHTWADTSLYPYQVTAALLAAAIDNRRQSVLLAERGQQIAVLEERRRLARELHDSVTQSLFSMSLLAQVLPDLWEVDREEARAGLLQIRDLTRSALAEMRVLLLELRPAALGQRGLAHALREYADAFAQRTGVPVAVDLADDQRLPEAVEQALFRITQEALANIARHANARQARITLTGGQPTRLQIADDGQGFHPQRVALGGLGLSSMRERAAGAGARIEIRSAIGQGTEIVIEWPEPKQSTKQSVKRKT